MNERMNEQTNEKERRMDREMKGGTEGRIASMERGILYFLEGRNQVALICAAQGRYEHAETSKEAGLSLEELL